ncbi:SIS domain-containing protein [bacterium]|nr:SIS domain-containing protein [bacterium]
MKYLIKNRLEQFKGTVVSTEISNEENLKFSLEDGLNKIYKLLLNLKNKKGNLYIIGNGGSAAIASHAVIDFMNVANISAHTLHDSASLTCMANDYGYENAFSRMLNIIIKKEDMLIIISSSGKSKNMINAGKIVKEIGSILITLSGFNSKNTLRTLGDINIWSNSEDYGIVEVTHQFILHNLADRFLNATIVK